MAQVVTPANVTLDGASTPTPLSDTDLIVESVIIVPLATNTDDVFVGGSGVDEATTRGVPLGPGQPHTVTGPSKGGTIEPFNLADVWFDSTTAGMVVSITYMISTERP